MTPRPLVYIVIVNWNGWQDTSMCIRSCQKLVYPNFRILVVDNGSSDNSEMTLRGMFPDLEVLQTGRNLGFSGGNNVGIQSGLDHGADYIWLLNNDTTVDPHALNGLVDAAEEHNNSGIFGSKIYYYDDPNRLWFAGGWINRRIGRTGHFGSGELDNGQYDKLRQVDYVSGCSFLIPRELVSAIGLLDTRYFLLFEETDWNERARLRGRNIYFVPSSKVWHKISQSLKKSWSGYYYYLTRNSLLFTAKHHPFFLWSVAIARILETGWMAFRGEYQLAISMLQGMVDFCCCRFGPRKG